MYCRWGGQFQGYPDTSGDDGVIANYKISTFNNDHELFNKHVGRGNNISNDKKEAQRKQTEQEKAKTIDDVSDLGRRFHNNNIPGYKLLLGEFKSVGG